MRIALVLAGILIAAPAGAGQCIAQSGPHTAALVELYTSEGCSSCPPAERWLSDLGTRGYAPAQVVPIALHVDYWHYLGDPHAKRELSLRQRKLTKLQRMALVYTPQVMLQGRDFRGWGTRDFDAAVAKINARPERVRLALEIVSLHSGAVVVRVAAELLDQGQAEDAVLYLAAYENRLRHVVLEWQGPIAISRRELVEQRQLPLLPKAVPGNSGVAGFVQNRRSAEVLQALMLPAC